MLTQEKPKTNEKKQERKKVIHETKIFRSMTTI